MASFFWYARWQCTGGVQPPAVKHPAVDILQLPLPWTLVLGAGDRCWCWCWVLVVATPQARQHPQPQLMHDAFFFSLGPELVGLARWHTKKCVKVEPVVTAADGCSYPLNDGTHRPARGDTLGCLVSSLCCIVMFDPCIRSLILIVRFGPCA